MLLARDHYTGPADAPGRTRLCAGRSTLVCLIDPSLSYFTSSVITTSLVCALLDPPLTSLYWRSLSRDGNISACWVCASRGRLNLTGMPAIAGTRRNKPKRPKRAPASIFVLCMFKRMSNVMASWFCLRPHVPAWRQTTASRAAYDAEEDFNIVMFSLCKLLGERDGDIGM